jgi:CRISPR/Cas system CSM-associated protein Csm3 (group 7 of RAMP superfamily)
MRQLVATFDRVRITGHLRCLGDLSIGSGTETKETRPARDGETAEARVLDICRFPDGRPYVPGSTLRGLLSDLCRLRFKDHHARLFGDARGAGSVGALRVYDAPLAPHSADDPAWPQLPRTRNSIDPITGTARDQHLFSFHFVPQGRGFDCELELDQVTEAELGCLLALLRLLREDNRAARLGRGASRLEGRVEWIGAEEQVCVLRPEALATWLVEPPTRSLETCFKTITPTVPDVAELDGESLILDLRLYPQGPILVDPERPDEKVEGQPDMLFRRDPQSRAVLPAASLRGWLRGQCRRILLTLLIHKLPSAAPPYEAATDIAENLIGALFGTTGRRSAVALEDAIGTDTQPHPQMFNAVDRFTGGVAEGALYQVEAVIGGCFQTRLHIQPAYLGRGGDWWKGLLALALRDALEGDVILGWGKAKGYGRLAVAVKWPGQRDYANDWYHEILARDTDRATITDWVRALHTELDGEIAKLGQNTTTGARHG